MSFKLNIDSRCIQVTKSIFVPNVRRDFHIYIARQSATLANSQKHVSCGNMNMDISPYILKFKFFFKDTCSTMTVWIHVGLLKSKNKIIYLPKKVCLIIIHRNTTHLLDMSCRHKHQQQRYHNENNKICLFIHYIYVDILFPLTKVIPSHLNVLLHITKLCKHG